MSQNPPPGDGWGQPSEPPSYEPQPGQGQQPPYGQQPGYGAPYGPPPGQPPENYLVWSILTTVLCCLPLGVVSIVYAAQVNSKWAMGDVAGAQDSSAKAKKWAIWSAAVAGVLLLLYIAFFVVVLVIGLSTSP